MGSCCRGTRQAPPAETFNSYFCSKCKENLHSLFLAAATHMTRGQAGDATVLVPVNCPKCNAVNRYKMNVRRQVQR